ncbi:Hypothetical predicted protein [Olea europaea subsp. europaea]|uniref:Uncharacterized protein n=1 Tax=Olea europaea subsp. europaea TaxID=158383 RepID=A0A8S0PKX9_OLEEU|nr:Hypothetical predicted protein [Olea europaea subsp. europaea]
MFNSHLLSAIIDLGIRGNARNWGSVCSTIGSSISTASELDVYQTATTTDLHVSATLRPTEAELGQPYISTLLPFGDRTVPALDNVARDIIPSQLHLEPLACGGKVGNSRGECALVSSGGGSEEDEESGDSDDKGAGEETGVMHPPHLMYNKVKPLDEPHESWVEELLLDQRTLIEIRLRTIKLEIIQHVTDEFVKVRDFISTLVPPSLSRSTPPTAQAANEPTVLGGAGMESEPPMNSDDDKVTFDGSGKREDNYVASPTGIAEAEVYSVTNISSHVHLILGGCGMDSEPENNSDDDNVPSGGSGNCQDKPIVYASGVAEVDVQMTVHEDASTPSMVIVSQLAVHVGCLTGVNVALTNFLLLVAMIVV